MEQIAALHSTMRDAGSPDDAYLTIGAFRVRKVMRWFLGALLALLVAIALYVASAAISLNGLVQAVRAGDGAAIVARTDMPRLRHSLVDQIVSAYLKRIGQDRPVKPLERMLANTYGASIADAMVGKLLTQETLTNMLKSGAVTIDNTASPNMPPISEIDTSRIFQTLGRLSLVKPVEFQIRFGDSESSGGISLHFETDGWKLSGVQLPAATLQALAQALPDKGRKS
jgi:hypothetical protein